MARSITVALLSLGLLQTALFGCSPDRSAWYGKWEGKLDRASPDAPNDGMKEAINSISLTLLPDGTFQIVESGIPKSGEYVLGSEKGTLKVRRVFDRPIEDLGSGAIKMNLEVTVELQEDGSLIYTDPGSFADGPIRMTKAPQR